MTARNAAVPAFAAASLVSPEKWQRRAIVCAALVGASALIVAVEWSLGASIFSALVQGGRPVNPVVAVALLLAAISTWLLGQESSRASRLQLLLAFAVAALGTLRLVDLFVGAPDIDLWLSLTDEMRVRTARMTPRSAVTHLLLGSALIFVHYRGRTQSMLGHGALILLFGVTTLTTLEYVYGIRVVSPTNDVMALSTALAAITLALGIFGMTADRGLAPILTNTTAAATVARRLLLAILLGSALLGYMRVNAERHGVLENSEQGVAIMVTIASIIGVTLLLWNASVQAKAEMFSAHLATIVRDSAAGIASATVDGRILTWNEGAERIYGHPAEAVIGKSIAILAPPEEQAEMMVLMKRIEQGEASVKVEATRLARDGLPMTLSIRLSPIRTADGRVAATASVFEDITAERRRRAELEQARKLASVGKLAGGVAHHLNNSLTVVIGHADLARELLSANHEAVAEVDAIGAAARDAARVVQMLMSAAGVRVLANEPIDVVALIQSNRAVLAARLPEPERLLVLPEHCPPIPGDSAAIVEMISALLENAGQASPPGREVIIRTRPRGVDQVMVEVIDFGIGMDVETRRQALDPFFTTKGLAVSSGMGLAIVHGTIRQMGGSIQIDSTPGRGTTVRLVFPTVNDA